MTLPSPAPVAERPAINRIGRFHITRELGRGAVGTVYLGRDPIIDRDVAIKTFNAAAPAGKKRVEQQFLNEARAAGKLGHPNIVTVYDAFSEGGMTYIAMEYLVGQELSKILDSGHRFTSEEVASIGWKIADALEHAHQRGVIHRDVKPANIFLVGEHQPKLVDFGIARSGHKNPELEDAQETLFHQNLLGTPNYMSPEQAMGEPVDGRSDVYALGVVMYEMLTGRKPFQGDTEQVLHLIVSRNAPAPHRLEPGVPTSLSAIVQCAMAKQADKRYQSAGEMALAIKRDLMRKRHRRDVLPMPMSVTPAPPGGSYRLALLFASGLLVLLALVAVVWTWMR